jgi:predicted dehydrogenase
VCDRDRAARDAAARASGAGAYADLSAMLEEGRPDVVHILTPPQGHRELGVAALRAGCHVLVEKPLAMTSGEADEMMRAARAAGVRLGVWHNFLFEPGVMRALAMLRAGDLGRLVSVDVFWRIRHGARRDRYRNSDWIHHLPGGVFQEVAPHALYLQAAFLGRPRIAATLAKRIGGEVVPGPDELRVLLEGDEALGSVAISVHAEPHQASARIYGTEMTLALDLTTNSLVKLRARGTGRVVKLVRSADQSWQLMGGTLGNAIRTICGRMRFGHETLIRAFYGNLRRGQPPPVDGAQGRLVVALLEEITTALAAAAPATET